MLDRDAIDLIAVVLALALPIAIVVRARWRAKSLSKAANNLEEHSGPGPTQAHVEAAEASIREKTTEAVRIAKARATKSLLLFLSTIVISVPFSAGMPLNVYFRPWGQLAIIVSGLSFAFAVFTCSGVVITWLYKRDLARLLDNSQRRQ